MAVVQQGAGELWGVEPLNSEGTLGGSSATEPQKAEPQKAEPKVAVEDKGAAVSNDAAADRLPDSPFLRALRMHTPITNVPCQLFARKMAPGAADAVQQTLTRLLAPPS